MKKFEVLNDRAVVEISGKDCFTFLQSVISNDIELVKKQPLIYALILTPQGRFLYDIFIFYQDGALYLDCYVEKQEELLAYLKKYKLRADVSFDVVEDLSVVVTDEDLSNSKIKMRFYQDPRIAKLGFRGVVSDVNKISDSLKHEEFYQDRLHDYAVPQGHIDLLEGRSFPLDYGLDHLNGVSFTKGCFIGQELTARMKHRGMIRKRIYKITSEIDLDNVKRGEDITSFGGKKIGEFLSGKSKAGLGLIRIEDYEASLEQEGKTFSLKNHKIFLREPEWVG